MRIISGRAGGIRLTTPSGNDVRPTGDRVKESVFASLGDLTGLTVVDLFAGSGALGLEALSRGAAKVVFVEINRRTLRWIDENIARVRKAMGEGGGETELLCLSAANLPARRPELANKVDVCLADPPYQPKASDYGAVSLLTDAAFCAWAGDALLVLEHASGTPLPWHPESEWNLQKIRRFGTQAVAFARRLG